MPRPKKRYTKAKKRNKYRAQFHELKELAGYLPLADLCSIDDAEFKIVNGKKRKRSDAEFSNYLDGLYEKKLFELKAKLKTTEGTPIKDALQRWITTDVGDGHKSAGTLTTYLVSADYYLKALPSNATVEDYKPEFSTTFKNYLESKKLAENTISKHFRHVQRFYQWCFDDARILDRPVKLTKPPAQIVDAVIYTREQLNRQLEHFQTIHASTKRHKRQFQNLIRAYMLGYFGLMRTGEMINLPLSRISLKDRLISVDGVKIGKYTYTLKTKTSRRVVPIFDWMVDFLEDDLKKRTDQESWYLDNGNGDRAFSTSGHLAQAVRRKNRTLGFDPKIDPVHGWRKAGTTKYLEDGMPLQLVQVIAGHSNPKTTMDHYVDKKRLAKSAIEWTNSRYIFGTEKMKVK